MKVQPCARLQVFRSISDGYVHRLSIWCFMEFHVLQYIACVLLYDLCFPSLSPLLWMKFDATVLDGLEILEAFGA